jgi:hypothetical protein
MELPLGFYRTREEEAEVTCTLYYFLYFYALAKMMKTDSEFVQSIVTTRTS